MAEILSDAVSGLKMEQKSTLIMLRDIGLYGQYSASVLESNTTQAGGNVGGDASGS